MSRNRAILLTILGIIAAYFIIRGINAWGASHNSDEAAVYGCAPCEQITLFAPPCVRSV
ncbi:MAG: hypothetical protein ACOX66_08115 [Oscillospiraceae bacterium]|jgi:hypothetical protein